MYKKNDLDGNDSALNDFIPELNNLFDADKQKSLYDLANNTSSDSDDEFHLNTNKPDMDDMDEMSMEDSEFGEFDFNENMALTMDDDVLNTIGHKLRDRTKEEFNKRSGWIQTITQSLRYLGLKNNFDSGSNQPKLINSAYLESWLQLCAEYTEELFPPRNIVATDIINRTLLNSSPMTAPLVQELEVKSMMICEDINQKIYEEWDDFLPELEKGIQSTFLTGGAVFKLNYDSNLGRPVISHISPEDIIIPADTKSLSRADIIIHLFKLSQSELDDLIEQGIYRNVEMSPDDEEDIYSDEVKTEKDRMAGTDESEGIVDNDDEVFIMAQAFYNLSPEQVGDDYALSLETKNTLFPYKITYQISSGKIVEFSRGWYQEILPIQKRTDMFKLTFMPSIDFWGNGLIQLTKGLQEAATVIENELITALRLSNTPTAVMSDSISLQNNDIELQAGQVNQIPTDSGNIADSFRDVILHQPNAFFKELLDNIENKIKRIASISQFKLENLSPNISGNILLSIMRKETKLMSGVMRRFIYGINQMFRILQDIMANELGDLPFANYDPSITNQSIYSLPIKLLSAADPTFSDLGSQLVRIQSIMEMANQHPELHNLRELYYRFYEVLKEPNIDAVLKTQEQLDQEQKQQQEMQQKQLQIQEQQVQVQSEQQILQNQLLTKDIEVKQQSAELDYKLKKLKMDTEKYLSEKQIENEMISEKGKNTAQSNVEITKQYSAYIKFLIEKIKLQYETGMVVPDLLPPPLKEFIGSEDAEKNYNQPVHQELQELSSIIPNEML